MARSFGGQAAPALKIGFDDAEAREFAKALNQNLYVQTPLQVLLETLFARMQAQADVFLDMQKRLESVEKKGPAAAHVAEVTASRVQKCEQALGDESAGRQAEIKALMNKVERIQAEVMEMKKFQASSRMTPSRTSDRDSAGNKAPEPAPGLAAAISSARDQVGHSPAPEQERRAPGPLELAFGVVERHEAALTYAGVNDAVADDQAGFSSVSEAPRARTQQDRTQQDRAEAHVSRNSVEGSREEGVPFSSGAAEALVDILDPASSSRRERSRSRDDRAAASSPLVGAAAGAGASVNGGGGDVALFEGRLCELEVRLDEVYNMSGKMAAIKFIADQLEVPIPDLQANPDIDLADFYSAAPSRPQSQAGSERASLVSPRQADLPTEASRDSLSSRDRDPRAPSAPSSPPMRGTSPAAGASRHTSLSGSAASLGKAALAKQASSMRGANSAQASVTKLRENKLFGITGSSKLGPAAAALSAEAIGNAAQIAEQIAALTAQVNENAAETASLREFVETFGHETGESLGKVHAGLASAEVRLDALEADSRGSAERVGALALEVEAAKAAKGRDDLMGIKDQVEDALARVAGIQDQVVSLVETDFKKVQQTTTQLALSQQLAQSQHDKLQAAVHELQKTDPNAPRDMDTLFHDRISTIEAKLGDMKEEVQMAVSEVLEDMAKMSDLDDLATILETKATSEEVKHLAQQQSHLAISINGVAEAVSSVRALVAGGAGAAAGTGEHPVLFSVMGASLGGSMKKGTGLLPRLDATHASASPSGMGVSDHRKHARSPNRGRAGSASTSANPSSSPAIIGQDYADYGAQEDPHREARMDRTTRTIDGRVALNLPAGGLKAPPGPKAPIFIA